MKKTVSVVMTMILLSSNMAFAQQPATTVPTETPVVVVQSGTSEGVIELKLDLLQQTLIEFKKEFHDEALLANEERLQSRAFRAAVESEWKKFGLFFSKFVLPAVGGVLAGIQLGRK